jgi:hypothetical protein
MFVPETSSHGSRRLVSSALHNASSNSHLPRTLVSHSLSHPPRNTHTHTHTHTRSHTRKTIGSEDGDLDEDEYEEMKADTQEQLKEFQESLKDTAAGNLSLVDSVAAMNLVRALLACAHRSTLAFTSATFHAQADVCKHVFESPRSQTLLSLDTNDKHVFESPHSLPFLLSTPTTRSPSPFLLLSTDDTTRITGNLRRAEQGHQEHRSHSRNGSTRPDLASHAPHRVAAQRQAWRGGEANAGG